MTQASPPGPTGPIERSEAEVVVVGGGPVGLAMTIELGLRGIDVLLVDDGDGIVSYPQAESLNVHSMEWLRSRGYGDAIDDAGFPADYARDIAFVTTLNGVELARFKRPSNAERRSTTSGHSIEGATWWPKFWFDVALRDRAVALDSVRLRYQWRCAGIRQDAAGVAVTLERNGEEREVRAQFVVGCDGAQSSVRRYGGFEMLGSPREARWQGAMLEIRGLREAMPFGAAVQYYLLSPRRLILGSLDGADLWRATYPLRDGEGTSEAETLAAVHDALDGLDVPVVLHGIRSWSGHSVVADRFRDGRVFLAGDAAHLMWPSGGHGMNTGLGDIQNLGWKLEAELRGRAGTGLLDSYEEERRPIAERNVDRSARNYAADISLPSGPELQGEGPQADALRQGAVKAVWETREREWVSLGMQIGFRYRSAILPATVTAEPPDDPSEYVPVVRVGHRAPHIELADGSALIDALGREFAVVRTDADLPVDEWTQAFKLRGHDLHVIDAPAGGAYTDVTMCLVRPDGFVCWEPGCTMNDPDDVAATVLGYEKD